MGLFDKKFCDICGEKIGLLGNRKLEDGNLCKDCAKKLSPFFSDRRRSTVNDIKGQLQYREQNRLALRSFNPDRVFGEDKKFFIDSAKGAFVVARRSQNDWDEENPDIISFSSVNSCNLRIDRDEEEQYYENANGESVSYNPPRYSYSYSFVLEFNVNHPYFDDFEVELNSTEITDGDPAYMSLQQTALNIMSCVAPGKFTMPQGGAPVYQQNTGYGQPQGMYNQPVMNSCNQAGMFNQPLMNQGMGQPMYGQPPVNAYNQGGMYNQPAMNSYPQQTPYQQPPYQQPMQNMNNTQGASWFCPSCGTPNTGNFCQTCGTRKA